MYKKSSQGWLKHLDFIVLDLICLCAAYVLAYAVRMGSFYFWKEEAYRSLFIVILLSEMAVTILSSSFKNVLKRGYYKEFTRTLRHVCLLETLVIVYLFTIQESVNYSRVVVYLLGVFYFLFSYLSRQLWKQHLWKSQGNPGRRSLLIVTTGQMAREAAENIRAYNYERFRLAGLAVLDRDLRGTKIADVPVIAGEGFLSGGADG